jgi:hypothetical protein
MTRARLCPDCHGPTVTVECGDPSVGASRIETVCEHCRIALSAVPGDTREAAPVKCARVGDQAVTALRIDKGDPAPGFRVDIPDHAASWVKWQWCAGGTFLAVECRRCGHPETNYATRLATDPGWLVETVKKHNSCVPRLGALDPWEPGTP